MDNTFLPKGLDFIKEAKVADEAEDFPEALRLYKQGLKYLIMGEKYTKNEKAKAMINEKIKEYFDRAEYIKKEGIEKGPAKKAVPVGGDGKDTKEEGKDENGNPVDPEQAKLMAALQGAIVSETPNVKWDDVAGLEGAKDALKEAVILPIKFPQLFTGKRTPWKGILLFGPPGTGKSFLAKAVATEAGGSCFLSVTSSDLVSKFQGESERLVKNLFELARMKSPAIIFIDEIDSLCGNRSDGENDSARRIKTEFLTQMQGVGRSNDGVLVLGATNTPWTLDPAIRRRFEKRVYIPLPEAHARVTMFKLNIGDTANNLTESDFAELGAQTDMFSGSDISVVVRDALYEPVRTCQMATHFRKVKDLSGEFDFRWEPCSPGAQGAVEMNLMDGRLDPKLLQPPPLCRRHFEAALTKSKSSVGQADLKQLEDWTAQFGQEGS